VPTPPVPPRVRRPTDRRRARAEGITDWHLRHRDTVHSSRDTYLPRELAADVRQRVAAVLLGAPPEAVLSHQTAAALWRLQLPLVADDPRVHLTVPPGRRVRQRADRRIHCSVVPPGDRSVLAGVCVTSLERTWVDLARLLPPAAVLAVADQILRRGVGVERLTAVLSRARGARGVRTARLVLPLADARAGSPMESVLRWLLHDAGLPAPVLQHVVGDGAAGTVGAVDLAWPAERVVVEFDGDGHRERRVFVDDLRRQNGLILAGWTVLRFSSADLLGRPTWVIETIRRALVTAGATNSW
jgi:Protein of unknown function (DUF559)